MAELYKLSPQQRGSLGKNVLKQENRPSGTSKREGFTLMELSIVLVIIGLLVGGTLVGKHLLSAAEVMSAASDVQAFETAITAFQEKYRCKPGDCTKANDFGVGVNGDGSGWINFHTTFSVNQEYLRIWQHLSNAGFINGQFTGISADNHYADTIPGLNVPSSRFDDKVGYSFTPVTNFGALMGHANYGQRWSRGKEMIWLGERLDNDFTRGAALKVESILGLDKKFDDGRADSGNVRVNIGRGAYSDDCTTPEYTDGTVSEFDYDLTKKGSCSVIFLIDWK